MKNVYRNVIALCVLIASFSVQAQLYKSHDWNEKPVFYELTEEDKKLSSVAIKEKYLIQYYNPPLAGDFKLFETKHSIIQVNSDKGIEKHNRVYVPMYNVKKMIDIKARVLTPDKKVKVLNKKKIKELKNVKGYGNFKIFAVEGLVKGAQVEFIYTVEKNATSLGSLVVQKDYQVNEVEVIIRKPRVLRSRIKPYNGFPTLEKKVVEGNKEAYTATATNVKAMIKEGSAAPDANRMKVSYQVAPSFISNNEMWKNLETNIQNQYLSSKTKKYKRYIEKYTKATFDKPRETEAQIINTICEYVNSNFSIVRRSSNSELNDLRSILSKGKASQSGIAKVYALLLKHEGVYFDFVLAANRFRHTFDSSFFSSSNLQEALLYFPSLDKYIVPGNVNTRLSGAPQGYISTTAIFVSEDSWDFNEITVPAMEETMTKRDYIISLDIENEKLHVKNKQLYTGYKGVINRGAHKYFKSTEYDEFKNMMASSGIKDADITRFDVKNEDHNLITENIPMQIDTEYSSEDLYENLRDDILISFGKVIGTQGEFYQEEERVNPVELDYLNYYDYIFEIEIPDGYTPKGLEELTINKTVSIAGEEACSFVSNYEVAGNKIIIKAQEKYKMLQMEVEYYKQYADVVNAAYDFSNLSILFEKK